MKTSKRRGLKKLENRSGAERFGYIVNTMDVEAKRIMALSISKLYSLRTQRGGLRLHRSLLLSMTVRAARDIYHIAQMLKDAEEEQVVPCAPVVASEEPMEISKDSPQNLTPKEFAIKPQEPKETQEEDKENRCASERHSRKRRGNTALETDFLPLKKEKMETDEEKQHLQGEVLRTHNGNSCRQTETLTAFPTNRTIGACWTRHGLDLFANRFPSMGISWTNWFRSDRLCSPTPVRPAQLAIWAPRKARISRNTGQVVDTVIPSATESTELLRCSVRGDRWLCWLTFGLVELGSKALMSSIQVYELYNLKQEQRWWCMRQNTAVWHLNMSLPISLLHWSIAHNINLRRTWWTDNIWSWFQCSLVAINIQMFEKHPVVIFHFKTETF